MKLNYNKVISQKLDNYDEDEYKKLKEDKRREDRRIYGRPEWSYYLWYLHLKLCLEMEEKKIPIQRKRKYRSGVKEQRKVSHIHQLKINRKVYEGIDWDELKSIPWYKWRDKYLDVLISGDIKKIEHGDEWKCEPQYLYLEVDMRNTESLLVDKFRNILRNEKKKNLPSRLGIQGSPKYQPLILGYNMMIGMMEGDDWINTCNREENYGRMEELLKYKETRVKGSVWEEDETLKDETDKMKELETYLRSINKGDMSQFGEFEGFCYSNLHRYIIRTQKILFHVSQGRFYDKSDLPQTKWKDSWSKKTYLW